MANRNKDKGKAFEREIAKHLKECFSLHFNRVPNSGAFVGGKNRHRADQLTEEQIQLCSGDIIVPKELSHVEFECKWYKEFSWNKLFSNQGEAHLNKWILQSEQTNKLLWFICFRINRQGEFVCYPIGQMIYNIFPVKTQLTCFINDKSYIITKMDGFFEKNRQAILNARE